MQDAGPIDTPTSKLQKETTSNPVFKCSETEFIMIMRLMRYNKKSCDKTEPRQQVRRDTSSSLLSKPHSKALITLTQRQLT